MGNKKNKIKTLLWIGITTMVLTYFFMSISNRTWDVMEFSNNSAYWFGAISFMGWFIGFMVVVLDLDECF